MSLIGDYLKNLKEQFSLDFCKLSKEKNKQETEQNRRKKEEREEKDDNEEEIIHDSFSFFLKCMFSAKKKKCELLWQSSI